ncbi:MAG: hypothetical protein Kow0092_14000 [Deferrisomatales bacterium]
MASYRRGAKGPEVERIQGRLREEGLYAGPLDGIFGGGTEAAVRRFQRRRGLTVDGVVGALTWAALFPEAEIPEPAIARAPLAQRTLALTGSFETGKPVPECFCGISGDFDGQGISFGALQWNLGQGSLQPLLKKMVSDHPRVTEAVFGAHTPELQAVLRSSREDQLEWARSVQDLRRFRLYEPWRGFFKTLGRTPEFQAIETDGAQRLYRSAQGLCRRYGVRSQRALALMFDIKVQNGGIPARVRAQIERDLAQLAPDLPEDEAEPTRLEIIATRRAHASNPRWVEDVLRRKLTIARGRGVVHGHHYELDEQYGIGLAPYGRA